VLTSSSHDHNKGGEVSIFDTINQASPKDANSRHSFGERKNPSPNLKDLIDGLDQRKKSFISDEGGELQLLDDFAQKL
jgi:hypothetical protein